MMVAIPNAFEAGQAVQQARQANPGLSIVARAHSDEEVEHLTRLGADAVIMGEREIALGMLEWLDRPKTSDRSASAALPDGVGADPQG
jgi:CPA2 family monovalent cation:H+ antiporter-2